MGASCEGCQTCIGSGHTKVTLNVEVIHKDWADAVIKNKLAGIKGLHAENPSLINEYVDQNGSIAIHYAVRSKNEQILSYLLSHDANINARGGPNYNTALHEAVLVNNFKAVRCLYSHDKMKLKDKLVNNDNKTAKELCNQTYRREYVRAKQFGINLSERRSLAKRQSSIYFHGENLNTTSKQTIRRIVKETDDKTLFLKKKKEEIKYREKAVTEFGEECGVDIDEIAMILVDENPKKIWQQLTRNTRRNRGNNRNNNKVECVTKQTAINKILFGLTNSALKKKHLKQKRINEELLKQLTRMVCKKLPRKNGRGILEKSVFIEKFHTYLFELHNEMVLKSDEL